MSISNDGSLDAEIFIPSPRLRTYLVKVTPDSTAKPQDIYSVLMDYTYLDTSLILAQNVQIDSIPPQPYSFTLGGPDPYR